MIKKSEVGEKPGLVPHEGRGKKGATANHIDSSEQKETLRTSGAPWVREASCHFWPQKIALNK